MTQTHVHVGPFAQLKPTVNFANRMTAFPGQYWGPRTIPDCQLLYVISGHATLTLDARQIELSPGECVFYGENSPHWIVSSETAPVTFSSIHFNWDTDSPDPVHPAYGIKNCAPETLTKSARSYSVQVDGQGDVMFPHHTSLNLETLFMQIVREYRYEEQGFAAVLRGLLTQLLVVILRHQMGGQQSPAARRKIAPALEAIRKHPHISWRTEELADLCGYHPTYFSALFKETIGDSPKHYLVLERIRKAKHLLMEIETVEAVAAKLGYTSTHYFCRNFKSITGLTPTEFRRRSFEL